MPGLNIVKARESRFAPRSLNAWSESTLEALERKLLSMVALPTVKVDFVSCMRGAKAKLSTSITMNVPEPIRSDRSRANGRAIKPAPRLNKTSANTTEILGVSLSL